MGEVSLMTDQELRDLWDRTDALEAEGHALKAKAHLREWCIAIELDIFTQHGRNKDAVRRYAKETGRTQARIREFAKAWNLLNKDEQDEITRKIVAVGLAEELANGIQRILFPAGRDDADDFIED